MGPDDQETFIAEYNRKKKNAATAYFTSLAFLHYAYTGRLGLTLLGWFVSMCTLGIGLILWWIVDLFRIPALVRDYNSDVAVSVLRDQRIIMGR